MAISLWSLANSSTHPVDNIVCVDAHNQVEFGPM